MFEDIVNKYQDFDNCAQIYNREYNSYPEKEQSTINRKNRTSLRNAYNSFEQSVQDNQTVIHGFSTIYDTRIQSLYSLFRQEHFRGLDFLPRFYKIFQNNLIDVSTTSTKLFNEFIKGITFFHNEIDYPFHRIPKPLYHRNFCCGGESGPINNIEKCYIERLIYDCIYRKFGIHFPETLNIMDNKKTPNFNNRYFENRQDDGHENWTFNVVKQLYQATYPMIDTIEVEVNKNVESNIPLTVTIKHLYKNGTYVEDYFEKTYKVTMYLNQVYEENIKCERKDTTSGNIKMYHKNQSFEKENLWIEHIIGGSKRKNV